MCSNDDLVELCACEFEHYVDVLFQASRKRGDTHCPIIARLYPELDNHYLLELKRMTIAALVAHKSFREHGPAWAPPLPLNLLALPTVTERCSTRTVVSTWWGASAGHGCC
jgi:hypothetical protein